MAVVKSVLSRTWGALASLRGLRRNDTAPEPCGEGDEFQLRAYEIASEAADEGAWSIYSTTPESIDSNDEDLLFCKNNVYLTCPRQTKILSDSDSHSPIPDPLKFLTPIGEDELVASSVIDEMDHIPGYMHIATRGAAFGPSLVLNWSPNTIMDPREAIQDSTEDKERLNRSCISVDLGSMESIKILYELDDRKRIASGQVVVSSRERDHRIFCFKHGGLSDLVKKLRAWHFFCYAHNPEARQYVFTVFTPQLSLQELHPEEGVVNGVLTEQVWEQIQDPEGRILDKKLLLQIVFFKGIAADVRGKVWPLLLGLVEYSDTAQIRKAKMEERSTTFSQLIAKWEKMEKEETVTLGKSVLLQIQNDILRTDRSNPFYRGDRNPNIPRLHKMILTYLTVFRPDISYCQGMTDLLAPLLSALDNDTEAFYCFKSVMERSLFFRSTKHSVSLERQLELLRTLLQLLTPWLYSYLSNVLDGLSLLFCHRWLLVSFRREFRDEATLRIWESCWINFTTNAFHLFICVAIMAVYGQRVVDNEMNISELTIHFNSLAQSMPVEVVLSQARGYLHQFSKLAEVPCTVRTIMPDEFWSSPSSPKIICTGSGRCCSTTTLT